MVRPSFIQVTFLQFLRFSLTKYVPPYAVPNEATRIATTSSTIFIVTTSIPSQPPAYN